jgi:hypothetical protein
MTSAGGDGPRAGSKAVFGFRGSAIPRTRVVLEGRGSGLGTPQGVFERSEDRDTSGVSAGRRSAFPSTRGAGDKLLDSARARSRQNQGLMRRNTSRRDRDRVVVDERAAREERKQQIARPSPHANCPQPAPAHPAHAHRGDRARRVRLAHAARHGRRGHARDGRRPRRWARRGVGRVRRRVYAPSVSARTAADVSPRSTAATSRASACTTPRSSTAAPIRASTVSAARADARAVPARSAAIPASATPARRRGVCPILHPASSR